MAKDDIPKHLKRAVDEAERISRFVPKDVFEHLERATEPLRRFSRVQDEILGEHHRTADNLRNLLGTSFEMLAEEQRRRVEMLRPAVDVPGRIVHEALETQRCLLGGMSSAAVSLPTRAAFQAQGIADRLAAHRPVVDLLGPSLAQRVLTTLAPIQMALDAMPARLLSELSSRQVAMASLIAQDWASRLGHQSFADTFGGQILHSLEEIAAAEDEAVRERQIESLWDFLRRHVERLPRTGISRDAWAGIIVAVVILLVTLRDGARATKSIVDAIHDIPRMLVEEQTNKAPELPAWCERLQKDAGDLLSDAPVESGPLYVATRRVNMRLSPSVRSPRLTLLQPGQAVERIEKRRKWVHVRYFDYVAGEVRVGWIFSKYLQPIGARPRHRGR